ncbi:MAG: ABC transporter permease [Defluviitaleaceae bacterium]|nr:ABC transporter permease [Defluviitaleaceae bacterium]
MKAAGKKFPYVSAGALFAIALMCLFSPLFAGGAPRMDFEAASLPPSASHLFGTDPLGRDLFAMIFSGGRSSLFIGIFAAALSAAVAFVYGTAAGLAGETADSLMMRLAELLLAIPPILYVVTIQAAIGSPGAASVAAAIGLTSWMNVAKMVRTEVLRVRGSEYVLWARHMGGGFFYVMRKHLLPNSAPAVMFMVISSIGGAIAAEATLSFLGVGLPANVVSWGSLMSLSQNALLTGDWWVVLIPGAFLVTTLVCIVNVGEFYRRKNTPDT